MSAVIETEKHKSPWNFLFNEQERCARAVLPNQSRFQDVTQEDGIFLYSILQTVKALFQDKFQSNQYFACVRNGKSIGQQNDDVCIEFHCVDQKEIAPEDIGGLHNRVYSFSKTPPLFEKVIEEKYKTVAEKEFVFFDNRASRTKDTEISQEKMIAKSPCWTLVLKQKAARKGHIVAFSNKKFVHFHSLPPIQVKELFLLSKFVSQLFQQLYGSSENLMFVRNGEAAGQTENVAHVHFIPGSVQSGEEEVKSLYDRLTVYRTEGSMPEADFFASLSELKASANQIVEKNKEFQGKIEAIHGLHSNSMDLRK